MGLDGLALQLLNGLSHATTLFLMACGLTLIFGVTRIVNFAHGSFFMLGALWSAHALTRWWPDLADSAWGYAGAMLLGSAVAAAVGALAEVLLLRRMRRVPELYQLVATFGLSLALHDAMRWFFGPEEVFAPRFPGLKGAVAIGEAYFPTWQLFTLVLGPLVWLGLHLLLTRTLWGAEGQGGHARPRHAGRSGGEPCALDAGGGHARLRPGWPGRGPAAAARARQPADGPERGG